MKNTNAIQDFLNLVKENPNLPIVPLVWGAVVGDNPILVYWMGEIKDCAVEEFLEVNGVINFNFGDAILDTEDARTLLAEFIGKEAADALDDDALMEKYKALPWKKAITVYIEEPEDETET